MDTFWTAIQAQLTELASAANADDVLRILSDDRNPDPNASWMRSGNAQGFFAGSGGDDTVWEALREAGWRIIWSEASYFYVAEAPDGSTVTYIEGDIYRGDHRSRYDG